MHAQIVTAQRTSGQDVQGPQCPQGPVYHTRNDPVDRSWLDESGDRGHGRLAPGMTGRFSAICRYSPIPTAATGRLQSSRRERVLHVLAKSKFEV